MAIIRVKKPGGGEDQPLPSGRIPKAGKFKPNKETYVPAKKQKAQYKANVRSGMQTLREANPKLKRKRAKRIAEHAYSTKGTPYQHAASKEVTKASLKKRLGGDKAAKAIKKGEIKFGS